MRSFPEEDGARQTRDMKAALRADQRLRAAVMHAEGLALTVIAQRLQCSNTKVRTLLREAGVTP